MDDLHVMLEEVRRYGGIDQKRDIREIAGDLGEAWPLDGCDNGDDCAAIPEADGYSLLAMEGFINRFVADDPWFAGWCGLMVNLSDIAAMGGTPVAVVNALWSAGPEQAHRLMQGMAAASRAYRVPIVGGHTNLRSESPQLAVAVLGKVKRPLRASGAKPGHTLIAAIDLRGARRGPWLNWDAATGADPAALRGAMALLPMLAEQGLAQAAKDISQAGLLGTLVMLLESARAGADVDLAAIPRPVEIGWQEWLCMFPSYGYLLTVYPQHTAEVLAHFHRAGIGAAAIGGITADPRLWVGHESHRDCFWDLDALPLTGINP
ncbi:sll0787 family AIR synthase-like protein [Sodalis sp. dw_96]|uniref:sll0787 family AIR synthase-like protein n=1 Tax=Sodalis sp. dw_96 TaxID=2719794 RepID=UPI001BD3C8C3|nr:sll0787 family AIR synthase-like protein [Sodalis sp. dw_96]